MSGLGLSVANIFNSSEGIYGVAVDYKVILH